MSNHELLYDNKFINPNVDGIRNDEKDNLLNYLDEIENERTNVLRKEKSKMQKLKDEPIEEKVEYKKTLVNIDSRLRNKYPVNMKDPTIHRLVNDKYQIIDSIRLIKESEISGIINYIAEIALKEYIYLATNMKLWLTIQTWNNITLEPYEFYINYYDKPNAKSGGNLYDMQCDLINRLDLSNCYITIANVKYTITDISIIRITHQYDIIYRNDSEHHDMKENFIQLKIKIAENSSILDYLTPENSIVVKFNKDGTSETDALKTDAILHDFDNIVYKIAYPYGPDHIQRFPNIRNVLKDIILYEQRHFMNIIIDEDLDFTKSGIFEINKNNSFISISATIKFNIVYIECFDVIIEDAAKLLLKIQFLIITDIAKYENILSNKSNIHVTISKKGINFPLLVFNKTLYKIDSFYIVPYLQIRTNSTEFKYDPTKNDDTLINLNETLTDYHYYDIPNYNILKINTYFFIHMITLIDNTSDIQITHPNHGLKHDDKISVNLQQINKLYGKGGLIDHIDVNIDTSGKSGKLIIYTEHDILRTFSNILDRDNYYNDYTLLRKDMPDTRVCLELDILNVSTNIIKTHIFENVSISLIGTTYNSTKFNNKIYDFIDNDTFTNEINNFTKLKFHIETETLKLTDIDGNSFDFNNSTHKIIQSYNNTWYSYHINSTYQPFYTKSNSNEVVIFHKNHGFLKKYNLSGYITKIRPYPEVFDGNHISNKYYKDTRTFADSQFITGTDKGKIKCYTHLTNLKANMNIYINILDINSKIKFNNSPYNILEVGHYYDHEKINRNEMINTIYNYFIIQLDFNSSTPDVFEIDILEPFEQTQSRIPILKNSNDYRLPDNATKTTTKITWAPKTFYELATFISPLCKFYTENPNIKSIDHTVNQIKIDNSESSTWLVSKIEILKPSIFYNSLGYKVLTVNFIESIELITETDENGDVSYFYKLKFNVGQQTGDWGSYKQIFDIRLYISKYIILEINKYLNSAFNNNNPFEVIDNNNPLLSDSNKLEDSELFYCLIVKFNDNSPIINDTTKLQSSEILKIYHEDTGFGHWAPVDNIWLRLTFANLGNIDKYFNNGDYIKLNFNIDGLDEDLLYTINSISPIVTDTVDWNITTENVLNYSISPSTRVGQFDIKLFNNDITIPSKFDNSRTITLQVNGSLNLYELDKDLPINYINKHLYSINLNNLSDTQATGGKNTMLSREELIYPLIKLKTILANVLCLNNIPLSYINADYPTKYDRINGYHKIQLIDTNNYIIKINTPYKYNSSNNTNTNLYINNSSNPCIYSNFEYHQIHQDNSKSIPFFNNLNFFNIDTTEIKLTVQKINKIEQGYLYSHDYLYKLGRTFEQITEIKLISTEFPNSSQIIRNKPASIANNKIYWRIIEDGPVEYSTEIDPGNYSATSLKFEIQEKMNSVTRSFNNETFQEVIVSINSAKSLIEFRIFSKQSFTNNLNTFKGSNRLEIKYDLNDDEQLNNFDFHLIETGDIIVISNASTIGGIKNELINKDHIAYKINKNEIYVLLNSNATSSENNKGGEKIIIRKLIPFQLLFGKKNTFGKLLGFNRVNEPNYVQPHFMKVVSNYEYNKYNDSNNNTILDLSGERYIFILNELLGNLENSSFVKNAFAKIVLDSKPGTYIYNSHISIPIKFEYPISKLSELHFKFVDYYGDFFNFSGLDHSFTLEITEKISNKSIKSYISKNINILRQ
ncbi:hypothetical protein N9T73_00050 [bacterium]|nr:hypothetical protein [bacterium]